MRHLQPRFRHHAIAEQDQIHIQRTCRTWKRPLASTLVLDIQQQIKKFSGRAAKESDDPCVQKLRLRAHRDRICLDDM